MSAAPPLWFHWDGEAFAPLKPLLADKYYVVGQKYRLVEENERSVNSHNHQFAEIDDAWNNLPENLARHFPTPEHLRKYALIKAGYCNKQVIDGSRPRNIAVDTYSIITVEDGLTTIYTAQSQSKRAMGAKVFQDSKTKVLEIIAGMIAVTPEELKANAGQAA